MPLALQGIQVCTAANKPTHAFTVVLPLCRHPKRKLQRYEAYQQLRRENHMHTALTHHLGIRCLATVSLFAALAATQAQAGNVGVSIGIYVPGVPVYVAPPPPPPPPRAVRHMPPPYVVYASPPRGFYGPPPRHHIPPGHYKHAPKRRGHMHYGPPPHRR